MLVELRLGVPLGHSVEIGKQVGLILRGLLLGRAPPQQIVDQNLGMYLLLDIDRRRVGHQVGPVLLVLAAPDQLWVQIAVAAFVGHADGALLLFVHYGLEFGGRDIFSGCLLMS
ncbi:MAG: hypothetical protein WBY44_02515 [Bryobacteraceae bacterium]